MDAGHKYADDMLEQIAEDIAKEMGKATKRVIEKIKKHLKKYEQRMKDKAKQVDDGEITEQEYEQWCINEITTGSQWAKVRDDIASDLSITTENIIKGTAVLLTAVYLYNRNYMNDAIESTIKANTNKIVKLPRHKTHRPIVPKSPNPAKNRIWHRRKVESVIRQGMKKGHSIDKIAKKLENVSKMDTNTAIRTARTGVTAAENMARIDSFLDAEDMGISMMKQWYATKDSRTRKSHRVIDGERREVLEYFSNGLMYPADPDGEPAEVYNCRCTLLGEADGMSLLSVPKAPSGMGKYEWVGEKPIPKHYGESKRDYEERVRRARQ